MTTALVIKEVKESAWIWLVAVLAFAMFVLESMRIPLVPDLIRMPMGYARSNALLIPFVNPQIATIFGWIISLLAVGMGLWQSYGESWRGTYLPLLHLPTPRRTLFGIKIATGIALVLGIAGMALGIVCCWAATPGTHASPFEWSMTFFAWRVWLLAPLFYLGAFTTGLYPAHWLGTRFFPLLTAAIVGSSLLIYHENFRLNFWLFAALIVLADGVFLVAIFYLIRTRDFS